MGVTFTRTILRPWESYEEYHPGGCYDSTRNETLHEFKAYLLNIGADASMRTLLKHIDKTFMNTLYDLYDDLKQIICKNWFDCKNLIIMDSV